MRYFGQIGVYFQNYFSHVHISYFRPKILLLFRIQGTPKWISPTKTQKIDFRTITINSILY